MGKPKPYQISTFLLIALKYFFCLLVTSCLDIVLSQFLFVNFTTNHLVLVGDVELVIQLLKYDSGVVYSFRLAFPIFPL